MAILDRLVRVIRATVNDLLGKTDDPEKVLQQVVQQMEDDLISLRQSIAQAIATQKRTERQASQAESVAEEWYRRAELALRESNEALAKDALTNRQTYLDTANGLKNQLSQQASVVVQLKDNMRKLEGKLAEAKAQKDMYIARARSAQASRQLNEMLEGTGTSRAALDRMGEKVAQLESEAAAIAELNSDSLDEQFAALESRSNVDGELAAMKARLSSSDTTEPQRLPPNP